MAKLTDPGATERQAPQATAGGLRVDVPFNRHPAGFGVSQLGADIEHGATEIYHAQKVEEDRINTLAAEDAFTKLRNKQLDLSMGQDNGFNKLKGADAVTKPVYQEWNKKFDDAEAQVGATLTNDRQREKFKVRADVSRGQFQEELLRHVGHEADVYAKEVYDGTMDVERRSSVARWNSPNDVASSLERVKHAVEERADRYGWDAGFRDGILQQEQGKIHAAVIGQAISSGNYKYGQAWYDKYRDQIDLPTSKMIEVAVRDGAQKELTAGYTTDFLAGRNDIKALDTLQTKVMSDDTLDDTRKNMLVGRIQSRSEVLERRAIGLQQAAEKHLEKMIGQVNSNTRSGYEPTMDQMAPIISATKGTALEEDANQMVRLANATRKFRTATPNQQEQMLSDLETAAHKDPTRFDIQQINAFREIHQQQKAQLQKDPQTYAVRQGLIEPKPLDLSKPETQGDALAERFATGRVMSGYGAPFKPLTETETGLVTEALKKASPDEKRKYFAGLSTASGNDREGYSAIMSQLAPDDPVTAIAGDYAGKERKTASDLMLRGQAILNPTRKDDGKPDHGKLWPMPPEREMDQAFSSYEQEAFAGRPQLRNAFHQATKAIYAAKSSDAGDASGLINLERWDESMKLATGGVAKHNGKTLLMPYGMDKSDFNDALEVKVDQILSRGTSPMAFDSNFNTQLSPEAEERFQKWKAKMAPHDTGEDYDLRGAFQAGLTPDVENGHWSDQFKKPNHPTFSTESQYARFGTPGTWQGDTYVPAPAGSKPQAVMPKAYPGQLDPRVTRQRLLDMPLEPIGDGRYVFRAGDGILVDKTNTPVIVDFNKSKGEPPPAENTTVRQPEHNNILQ